MCGRVGAGPMTPGRAAGVPVLTRGTHSAQLGGTTGRAERFAAAGSGPRRCVHRALLHACRSSTSTQGSPITWVIRLSPFPGRLPAEEYFNDLYYKNELER